MSTSTIITRRYASRMWTKPLSSPAPLAFAYAGPVVLTFKGSNVPRQLDTPAAGQPGFTEVTPATRRHSVDSGSPWRRGAHGGPVKGGDEWYRELKKAACPGRR